MTDDPTTVDDQSAVPDDDVRGAFVALRVDANRIDLDAARRRLDGDSTAAPTTSARRSTSVSPGLLDRRRRLAPLLAATALIAGTVVGARAVLSVNDAGVATDVVGEPPAGGEHGPETDEAGREGAVRLTGAVWSDVELEGLVLVFDEGGEMTGAGNCLQVTGTYQTADRSLSVSLSDEVLTTRLGSPPEDVADPDVPCSSAEVRAAGERFDAVEAATGWRIDHGVLNLVGGDEPVVLEALAVAPANDIVGPTWWVDSVTEEGEIIDLTGDRGYLRLDPGGDVTYSNGCTSASGTWMVNDPVLRLNDLAGGNSCARDRQDQWATVANIVEHSWPVFEGDLLTLRSVAGTVRLRLGQPPEVAAVETDAEMVTDPTLRWSVILVADDDRLNVRSSAGVDNEIVGDLAPDATAIEAGTEVVLVGGETWRQVRAGSIQGWVNQRFLAAAPADFGPSDLDAMADQAAVMVRYLRAGEGARSPELWLSPSGLYLGGIGVFGDWPFAPRLAPAAQLGDRQGWEIPIDFTPEDWTPGLGACGACLVSPVEFIGFPDGDRSFSYELDEPLIDDRPGRLSFNNGEPSSLAPLLGMHHVTVDVPATSDQKLNWQRIHLFFDFRTGQPMVRAVYTWGSTP